MIFLGFAIADSLGAHCASDLVSGGRVFAIFVERRCDDRRGMSVKFHCKAVSPPQQLRVHLATFPLAPPSCLLWQLGLGRFLLVCWKESECWPPSSGSPLPLARE